MDEENNFVEQLKNNTQGPYQNNIQESYQNNIQAPYQVNIQTPYQNNIQEPYQNNIQESFQIINQGSNQSIINEDLKKEIQQLKIACYSIMIILALIDLFLEIIIASKDIKKKKKKKHRDSYDRDYDDEENEGEGLLILFLIFLNIFRLIKICCNCFDYFPICKIILFSILFIYKTILINVSFIKISGMGIILEITNFLFILTTIYYQITIKKRKHLKF